MGDLVFDLGPTQSAFVHSSAHIVQLGGPFGEGKTYAGAVALPAHALRCGGNIRGALIRDTHTNLQSHTVPDIKGYFGDFVSFHDDDRKMRIHSQPAVEMQLFGIDDPASMSKLQGFNGAIIWLEEPAPVEQKANAGLPKSVFDFCIARASRQNNYPLRVQLTHNPAEEDHWVEALMNAPRVYFHDADTGVSILKESFKIPYGENRHLGMLSRAAAKAAFKDDPGKYSRYVSGIAAPTLKGKPVTPAYNPSVHYAGRELDVVPGALGMRFWDSWTHPVCLIGQLIGPDWLRIHHCCLGSGIGPKELIVNEVLPLLQGPKYAGLIHEWRDIGDPTMRNPDQSTVTVTTARMIESELANCPRGFFPRFEAGPITTAGRVRPLNTALRMMRANGGGPQIEISSTAHLVHRCLAGGWHWKTDNSGNVIGVKPVKDKYGDIGDAMAYGVAKVFPYEQNEARAGGRNKAGLQAAAMAIAQGYGSSGAPAPDPRMVAQAARWG